MAKIDKEFEGYHDMTEEKQYAKFGIKDMADTNYGLGQILIGGEKQKP
jgi:hypothetical protein